MLCCKTQRKCSDSTYVEIAFMLIFGVLWPITVVTEVSFILFFSFFFFGRGWFPRVSIINMFNPLMASLAVFPADTFLRLEGVTSLSSQRCIFQPSCKHSLLHCKYSTCARMNFSPGILSSTTD